MSDKPRLSKEELDERYGYTLSGAYTTRAGFWSLPIRAQEFDALQKIEIGGRLVLNLVPEEAREKNPKLPHAFFKYLSAKQVAKADEEYEKRRGNAPQRSNSNSDDL